MTTEELHGQVARAATVERELRDRIRDLEADNINANARAEQATARLVKMDHELVETRTKLRAAGEAKERAERDVLALGKQLDDSAACLYAADQRATAAEGALVRLLETQTISFSDEQAAAIDHACDNVLHRRVETKEPSAWRATKPGGDRG